VHQLRTSKQDSQKDFFNRPKFFHQPGTVFRKKDDVYSTVSRHRIEQCSANMHGYFAPDLAPILKIEPGDTVEYRIPDANWNARPRRFAEDPPIKIDRPNPERDTGHCLAGPIYIRGAEPGDTLEIKVDELRVGSFGWTTSGGWPHPVHTRLGLVESPAVDLFWQLDPESLSAQNQHGHRIRLAPFLGVMGMPSDQEGIQPTPPPRRTGGNLDCKEIQVGSSLFLPIEVEGGLFSCGDGHAAQGDGEVCVTAIECPIDRAVLTFELHKDFPTIAG
jgi:acetamidase/formamidase